MRRPPSHEAPETAGAGLARRPVMVRFGAVLLRVPRYLKLAYHLTRDGRLSPAQRAMAASGAAYTISPIDPLPGFIPVFGQLDDLAVLLLTLRGALRGCPPELAEEHLARAGLSFAAIDADLAAIRATAVWVLQQAGIAAGRTAIGLARLAMRSGSGALGRIRSRRKLPEPR